MKALRKLASDFTGLVRITGLPIALLWLARCFLTLREAVLTRNLQAADRAMGEGPFLVRLPRYRCNFKVCGPQAFSGIREMYVRDVYLGDRTLLIEPGDVVIDLGANMGNFTCLALAACPDTRVIAVEPSKTLNEVFVRSVGLNAGFLERTTLIRAFVGSATDKQLQLTTSQSDDYGGAPYISEDRLIELAGGKIDFLKCDIEGSEFGLLKPGSRLLNLARKLACEVHAFAGDVDEFVREMQDTGFQILRVKRDPDGTATVLMRKSGHHAR